MKRFHEYAISFDLTPALRKIDKFLAQVKAEEADAEHPLYPLTKPRVGRYESVIGDYVQALFEMRAVITQHVHDRGILHSLSPVYRKWKSIIDHWASDEDAGNTVSRLRMDTNLYLAYEAVSDILKGQMPEPD